MPRARRKGRLAPPAGGRVTDRCRFAPTTSGPAHPGTLLAALLCWLDARSRDGSVLLRLEDADPSRCTPEKTEQMRRALAWMGFAWDGEIVQSERTHEYEHALDRLAGAGLLYPCSCSRSEIRRVARPAVDGGWVYPGTCRQRELDRGDWRAAETLRLRLPAGRVEIEDEGGEELASNPLEAMGDPVVRRRDGSIAYHLACVVDDSDAGISRVVRGRDMAPSTAIHAAVQSALGVATPRYRHHFLLLEEAGKKFAKLHGAVAWDKLRGVYGPRELCGRLAWLAGLRDRDEAATPGELVNGFSWERVRDEDLPLRWTGSSLDPLRRSA